jgi:phage shock protein PspC (stress-responsive transcriptional regulator)
MQRIAITATLNRSTLQFDAAAYARLEQYLAEAGRTLDGNPDRAEIIADLEQAVADQCQRRLPPGETIVTLAHLQPALEEIGPIQVPGAGIAGDAGLSAPRLQLVSEGAWIGGLCQGLARYFGLDVTLVRILAVVLLLASGGTMVVVYLVLLLLLPYAAPVSGAPPIRGIPARSRRFANYVRGRFGVATS